MDGSRIDLVARTLAARRSRRAAVRGGAGLAAAIATGSRLRTSGAQDATPIPDLRVRQNAKNLDTAQKTAYVNAVLALKKKPSPWDEGLSVYDSFVLWHRDAFSCQINAAHMAPAFLPWHRRYLLLFEEQLQSVDPTVNLCYWDWSVDIETDSYVWQDDFMGGDGDPAVDHAVTTGPFKQGSWEIAIFDYNDTTRSPYLIRDLGAGDLGPTLPTPDEVEAALNVPTYDSAPWNALSPIAESFRNTIEGWRDCVQQMCDPVAGIGPVCTGSHDLHNRVHLWVAGEFQMSHEQTMEGHAGMATPVAAEPNTPAGSITILGTMAANTSVSDPVFFLHHTNLDRLWNEWLRRHGQVYQPESGGPLGHNIDDAMWPYDQIGIEATPRMMLESRALGYVYDTD